LKDFLGKFSQNIQYQVFIKICPVGANWFHAERRTDGRMERQTDMTKLIFAFRSFANAPKNRLYKHVFENIDKTVNAEFCKE
jgi:hypothetical protein